MYVVNLHQRQGNTPAALQLEESIGLCHAIDDWRVVGSQTIRQNPDRVIGDGQVAKLKPELSLAFSASTQLTPSSAKLLAAASSGRRSRAVETHVRQRIVFVNTRVLPLKVHEALEEQWDCTVLDRFSLILRIFSQRARTRESQLRYRVAREDFDFILFLY